MTPEQFTYWLQGYMEIHGAAPSTEQWKVIEDHLKTVFNKVTPTYPNWPLSKDNAVPVPGIIPGSQTIPEPWPPNATKVIC